MQSHRTVREAQEEAGEQLIGSAVGVEQRRTPGQDACCSVPLTDKRWPARKQAQGTSGDPGAAAQCPT